jgi:hypothetical protein
LRWANVLPATGVVATSRRCGCFHRRAPLPIAVGGGAALLPTAGATATLRWGEVLPLAGATAACGGRRSSLWWRLCYLTSAAWYYQWPPLLCAVGVGVAYGWALLLTPAEGGAACRERPLLP